MDSSVHANISHSMGVVSRSRREQVAEGAAPCDSRPRSAKNACAPSICREGSSARTRRSICARSFARLVRNSRDSGSSNAMQQRHGQRQHAAHDEQRLPAIDRDQLGSHAPRHAAAQRHADDDDAGQHGALRAGRALGSQRNDIGQHATEAHSRHETHRRTVRRIGMNRQASVDRPHRDRAPATMMRLRPRRSPSLPRKMAPSIMPSRLADWTGPSAVGFMPHLRRARAPQRQQLQIEAIAQQCDQQQPQHAGNCDASVAAGQSGRRHERSAQRTWDPPVLVSTSCSRSGYERTR